MIPNSIPKCLGIKEFNLSPKLGSFIARITRYALRATLASKKLCLLLIYRSVDALNLGGVGWGYYTNSGVSEGWMREGKLTKSCLRPQASRSDTLHGMKAAKLKNVAEHRPLPPQKKKLVGPWRLCRAS